MEAFDTVMSDKALHEFGLWSDVGMLKEVAIAQAEISFKAGIEEVVELIQGNIYGRIVDKKHIHKLRIEIPLEDWQAKLKEWGITGG